MAKILRRTISVLMVFSMMLIFCNVAFAAEQNNPTITCEAEGDEESRATYVSVSGYFYTGTKGLRNCSKNITTGTYTVYYSVTSPCDLYLWADDVTCIYATTLSGSGTAYFTINPTIYSFKAWELTGTSATTYSLTIVK